MPSLGADPVREVIAQALAALREPDFSEFPDDRVERSLDEMFSMNGITQDSLHWLRDRIQHLSGGLTRLEDADKDNFRYLSKEWGAVYQRLVRLSAEQLVIIGRSSPQFLFVPRK
jgi:hypothetical protein